ncbi:DAHL domain-containing protein [Massilia sp. PWRC2]|uniref:DAHL domain-containing protein n=1 Tax=Massilia sp. PWRC2 TaxID=2804626 RepID=UPI003CED5DA6
MTSIPPVSPLAHAMSARRRLALMSLLLVLALLLVFLFSRTTAVDLGAQNRVMLNLHELEKLDAEWNANILRARIGLDTGSRSLDSGVPRMLQLQRDLGAALSMTHDGATARAYNRVQVALQEKQQLVGQFKGGNGLLRESLAALPSLITQMKTELTGIEGALAPSRTVLALDDALNALLADVLRFNLAPDAALATRIETSLRTVQKQKAAFSLAVGERIDVLLLHTRVVLLYRPQENRLEAAIAHTGTSAAIERLSRQFDREFDEVLLQKQRYRSWLFAYSGVLLLLLVGGALRLLRTFRMLDVANRRLRAVNDTLEQRVLARTAELEAQSAKLEQLAHHDGLTGLVNYSHLSRLLDHALIRAGRRDDTVVVMFFDLDGFKAVNDTHGHGTGDLVLQEVARRVQSRLRKEDVLARLGGDEFVIMFEQVDSPEAARRIAQLTLDAIGSIDEADGKPVDISASIGISSAHGRSGAARGAAALLADADAAMYVTKQAGKSGYTVSPSAQWPDSVISQTTQTVAV